MAVRPYPRGHRNDYIGLSTDDKPTLGVQPGASFYETDTGQAYLWTADITGGSGSDWVAGNASGNLTVAYATGEIANLVEALKYPITRVLAQGTSVATGTPTMTYNVDLSDVDMDTATLVLVSSAGTMTVEAQLSYDGATGRAPSTPITLFSSVAAGTHVKGLKNLLTDGVNDIYGHYMTGDIDIAGAASTFTLILMAQSR